MGIFEKYASKINAEELAASQQEIQSNAKGGGQREEVPVGKYEVKVDKLECKMSKSNNLMVSIWFRILKGKFEKSVIFYNGVFYEDWICDILDLDFEDLKGELEKINEAQNTLNAQATLEGVVTDEQAAETGSAAISE